MEYFFKINLPELVKAKVITDFFFMFITLIFVVNFTSELFMIAAYFLIYPYIYLTNRVEALRYLVVSTIVALIWVLIANNLYSYSYVVIDVMGISVYPFFAWASGLFGLYIIYTHIQDRLKLRNWRSKLMVFFSLYWPLLIALETIAYHVFDIKNLQTVAYSGLPLCDCIHAPVWMQLSYLALGPLFFIICLITEKKIKDIGRTTLLNS